MSQPSIYQLRIVLRDVSPLIWRRLLVRSDTTLEHLHTILQIVFAWSDEHLHRFQIHGKAYGSSGVQTHRVLLNDIVNLLGPMPSRGVEGGRLPRALPIRGHARGRDLLPELESLGHDVAILGGGEPVAPGSTVFGNGTIRGQEAWRRSR